MPIAKRYWKDPEKWKKESIADRIRVMRMGYPSGLRSPETYLKMLEKTKIWNKANPEKRRVSRLKHKNKVRAIFGTASEESCYLYSLLKKEER